VAAGGGVGGVEHGNWAATIALSLTVYAKTGSTVWLSASFLFTQVPSALVAPVSGAMADRLNRKRIMIICDLLGRPPTLGWPLLAAHWG
jgi:MFS transporter, DHA3 family, macrolide efflux protein